MSEEGSEDKGKPTGDEETVSKADYEALKASNDKLEKDLEDIRMEVITPEYQRFLDGGAGSEGDKGKPDDDATDKSISDDSFEKMTKKEIFDLAVKTAEDKIKGTLDEKAKTAQEESAAKTNRLVKAFAETHEDYDKYRPIMYGMSLDPKNADDSLQQLYDKAKEHVKGLHADPSEEEKSKSKKSTNEKPGGDSMSLEKRKAMSNDDIAAEAWAETEEKLGPIPTE